ncbi:MAG: restriction endonuclease, partial [Campylobacterota bacterium]|nr:restriction endonuclease [Campylobacterota bacterium]
DFGKDLKEFIDANYKKPYKFNTNLYATFIKRCHELTNENGKIAMLHPLTFMYIKTFEDVRKFVLDKTEINLLAELGLGGVFANSGVQADVVMYILSKKINDTNGIYFNLKKYKNHTNKPQVFETIYDNYLNNIEDNHISILSQKKLKMIKSFPFIYWISDDLRQKFKDQSILDVFPPKSGLATSDNNRFLRFWWEIEEEDDDDWITYSKGGPYNKWSGNLWLKVDWRNNAKTMRDTGKAVFRNEVFYFKEGITYCASGSKGASFRHLPENCIYDVGGASMFPIKYKNVPFTLAILNSKFSNYIINCLNPTVNTQVGDIERLPFLIPKTSSESQITNLSINNINIKNILNTFSLIEESYKSSILNFNQTSDLKLRLIEYLNYENHLLTQVLINEAIINEEIFKVYELTENDIEMILESEGQSIGDLPVEIEAKESYLENDVDDFKIDAIEEYINNLMIENFDDNFKENIISQFESIYQGNSNIEEFCIKHKVNPINVWYWFKESRALPKQRMNDISMEFLADMLREILMEDDDGIIPIVPNAGEKILYDRVQEKFIEKGFSQAQFSSFDLLLGKEINRYINEDFFKVFSNYIKLFKQLPMTPFIWHLSSGKEKGFEAFIIIYKWSRDNLLRLRSVYIEHRQRALENKQIDLQDDN